MLRITHGPSLFYTIPMKSEVILVDKNDSPIGTEEKLAAHQKGLLHRAFSVFVFNSSGELLIQKRARGKYHSGGLWTNTCCSHPAPGEETEPAAHRRLQEEMGFDCPMREVGSLLYRTEFDNGLVEHEFDHILIGEYNGPVEHVDPDEAEDWKWISEQKLLEDMKKEPEAFTYWFKLSIEDVLAKR
jgi:isopentenyl-diphosphate delta-isomerase